jgi:hypothetical protein
MDNRNQIDYLKARVRDLEAKINDLTNICAHTQEGIKMILDSPFIQERYHCKNFEFDAQNMQLLIEGNTHQIDNEGLRKVISKDIIKKTCEALFNTDDLEAAKTLSALSEK